jgi:hypothetical protein
MIGDLEGYGSVWYDPKAITNIFSLKKVGSKYNVVYKMIHGVPSFIVTKPDGNVFQFQESEEGLYYMNANESCVRGTVLVNTVAENKLQYTNEDYQKAVQAQELQIKIGRPSTKDFIRIVSNNQLLNCPVTKADIMAAEDIFGTEVGSLKGKTTRRQPHAMKSLVEPLPPSIMDRYQNVTLCVDIMFVNEIPMLVTLSRNIKFATVEGLSKRNTANLMKGIKSVISIYQQARFKVTMALMDGEFDILRGDLNDLGVTLNEMARDEHVSDIERFIQMLKEQMRAIYNMLPFNNMPPRLIIEMVKNCIYWLNAFPQVNGVSDTLSPRAIITVRKVDFHRHCEYRFGQYVQTHEQHDNSMAPRTIGAIALHQQGTNKEASISSVYQWGV